MASRAWLLTLGLWLAKAAAAEPDPTLRLSVTEGFLPGLPMLVRVDLIASDGHPAWHVWDDEVTLTANEAQSALTPSIIPIHNGRGSSLVTISTNADQLTLTARWNGQEIARTLVNLQSTPVTTVSGALSGTSTVWSGVIHVTNDVTAPAGHTLTVEPGTLILIDGDASGTSAPDLIIEGRIESLGTEDRPIAITSATAGLNWGQIRHTSAQPSLYRHTSVTRGGRANGEGHTGAGPVIRPRDSTITFQDCTISDLTAGSQSIGKIMQSSGGSDITFAGCILARARMGPELDDTAVVCTNSHLMNMFGPDDEDAIYIHSQRPGQRALIIDSVIAFMDDDGVDTLGSVVEVERCLIRDVFDKGTSVNGAETRISDSLYVDCGIGISSKTGNGATVTTRISQTSIQARDRGIAAENKGGGSPDATVLYWVTNTIIRATAQPANSIYTDYDPSEIQIFYSNLGEPWPGPGNQTSDPMWVDPASHRFQLQPHSPCIDQGDPSMAPDEDGSRSDIGYATFVPPPPRLSDLQRLPDGGIRFLLHGYTNRFYRIDAASSVHTGWSASQTNFLSTSPLLVEDLGAVDAPVRFYRAKLGP